MLSLSLKSRGVTILARWLGGHLWVQKSEKETNMNTSMRRPGTEKDKDIFVGSGTKTGTNICWQQAKNGHDHAVAAGQELFS